MNQLLAWIQTIIKIVNLTMIIVQPVTWLVLKLTVTGKSIALNAGRGSIQKDFIKWW